MLVLMAVSVTADDIALTRVGDSWRYHLGVTDPFGPTNTWRWTGYDDSLWLTGRSGFSAGYGSNEATELPVLTSYVAAYFRHSLLVTNPAAVQWLTLRIDYTDGFVAYLNGHEIARRNLEGPIGSYVSSYRRATNYHARFVPEEIDVSGFARLLVSGSNTLAVQVHSALPSSAGLCFSAELMANFNRAPFLQNCSSNQTQIIWKTPVPAETRLDFGPSPALGCTLLDPNPVFTHVATLTNLAPDSVYFYRAASSANGQTVSSPVESFRTFKTSGPLSFVAFGDGGWNSVAQYQMAEVIRQAKPDLVLETGDNVYPTFTRALVDTRCFSVYQPQMRSTPFFFAIGNHDIVSGVADYLEAFYLPTNSVSLAEHALAFTSPEHYYSFDHGDAHFTVLYVPFRGQYQFRAGDPQYRWLTNDLASTLKPWKIVIDHLPMNSSSAHRFDDTDLNGLPDRLEVRDLLLPVFSQNGVQLVLSGHEHGYERFNPTNGVHAITTAGGGVDLYGFTELDVASALFWMRHNCVKVIIDGDTLEAQALGTAGEVFDTMTIQRRLPPPRNYPASWFSPAVETAPANDSDGNIYGQSFDFAGEPIPTLTGRFSNLGRVYVNNDQTHLYVGFEQVMIYGNNNIFLFIESPGLKGVTNLLAVGNGVLDPNGQGADGLDFLENLSFHHFSPAVGCILGDEYGDGQFRNFARTNLALNIGQGVFRLNADLSDVPGIRLQQFHLSPQIAGALAEQNANFIQLAIPLSELGLRPGDTFRLGAVVGGPDFDVARQSRLLDSGFLGNSFTADGLGLAVLEGVEVQLAFDPQSDEDADGLSRSQELALGTDPSRADTDGDGLPDGWEAGHGMNPLSSKGEDGAEADPDNDGFINLQEYLAGTDPRNTNSAFRLKWERHAGRTLRLSWQAQPGRLYQVQVSDGPTSPFTDLTDGALPASTVSTNFTFEVSLGTQQPSWRFFRVRLAR